MNCPDCGQQLHPMHHSSDYHKCKIFLHHDRYPCPVTGSVKYLNGPPLRALDKKYKEPEDLPLEALHD